MPTPLDLCPILVRRPLADASSTSPAPIGGFSASDFSGHPAPLPFQQCTHQEGASPRCTWTIPAHLLLLLLMLLLIGIPIGLFFVLLELYFSRPLQACHSTVSTVSADAYANGQSALSSILSVAQLAVSQTASPMLQAWTHNASHHSLIFSSVSLYLFISLPYCRGRKIRIFNRLAG